MKLTASRSALLPALAAVAGCVSKAKVGSLRPVLSCVKLSADGSDLTLTATDMDTIVRCRVAGVDVSDDHPALIPHDRLSEMLKAAPDGPVAIDATDDGVSVKPKRGKFQLPGHPLKDFPDIAPDPAGAGVPVKAGDLRRAYSRVKGSVYPNDAGSIPALVGVLVEAFPDGVRLVASDTRRLAVADSTPVARPDKDTPTATAVVPPRAIDLLLAAVDDGEDVRVSLKARSATFASERVEVATRLLDGKYPPYRQFLARFEWGAPVEWPADGTAALRQASLVAGGEQDRVDFHLSAGRVVFVATGAGLGSGEVEADFPGWCWEGRLALDCRYCLDFLSAVRGTTVTFAACGSPDKPVLFATTDARCMVMTMVDRKA